MCIYIYIHICTHTYVYMITSVGIIEYYSMLSVSGERDADGQVTKTTTSTIRKQLYP